MNTQVDPSKYLTVSALNKYIKKKFDVDPYLDRVYVVGEVTSYRPSQAGHLYFTLKEDNESIRAVMYARDANKLSFRIEEGMKLFVVGRVSVYTARSEYQIIVSHAEPDGLGSLYLALEQLKKELYQRGWFSKNQRPLAKYPKKIVVITSRTGAVLHDILTTVKRRYPIVELVLYPTRVQGKEAVLEIVQAFKLVNERADEYDTVILARGGGSIEDLWCFNDEKVAQAILNCQIPVISSIGHETDTTIADLVADVRAATPTAAAELAVPKLSEVILAIRQLHNRIQQATTYHINMFNRQLNNVRNSYIFRQPDRLYEAYILQLDQTIQRLNISIDWQLEWTRQRLDRANQGMNRQQLIDKVKYHQESVNQCTMELNRAIGYLIKQVKNQVVVNQQLLKAHNPEGILNRGYSVVRQNTQVVKSVHQINVREPITIQLSDGQVISKVTSVKKDIEEDENNE